MWHQSLNLRGPMPTITPAVLLMSFQRTDSGSLHRAHLRLLPGLASQKYAHSFLYCCEQTAAGKKVKAGPEEVEQAKEAVATFKELPLQEGFVFLDSH